jgi:hypothetical protein
MELDKHSDIDSRAALLDSRAALLLAFGCGILTGLSLGLLFAPAGGRDTRHWMADRSRIAREYLRDRNRRAMQVVRRDGVRGLLHWQQEDRTADGPDTGARVHPFSSDWPQAT